jgi:hypothetical protein
LQFLAVLLACAYSARQWPDWPGFAAALTPLLQQVQLCLKTMRVNAADAADPSSSGSRESAVNVRLVHLQLALMVAANSYVFGSTDDSLDAAELSDLGVMQLELTACASEAALQVLAAHCSIWHVELAAAAAGLCCT